MGTFSDKWAALMHFDAPQTEYHVDYVLTSDTPSDREQFHGLLRKFGSDSNYTLYEKDQLRTLILDGEIKPYDVVLVGGNADHVFFKEHCRELVGGLLVVDRWRHTQNQYRRSFLPILYDEVMTSYWGVDPLPDRMRVNEHTWGHGVYVAVRKGK